MGPEDLSHDEFERLARIAHRYYVDGRTQEEIAREFGLSRPTVQRLLERARWSGVVSIHVQAPPWLNLDLEARLRDTFRLADAIVAQRRADPQSQREVVARGAAEYLERRLHDRAVIAVGHGRDAGEVPRFFRPRHRLDCEFVSRHGRLAPRRHARRTPTRSARRWPPPAGAARGASTPRPTSRTRRSATGSCARRRSTTRSGPGPPPTSRSWASAASTTTARWSAAAACRWPRSRRLRHRGAVGDILGNYVDIDGRVIASPHSERLIALSIDDLRRIQTVVAVVSEVEKPLAILGVLRSGVVDVLVVDEANARTILDAARDRAPGERPPGELVPLGRHREEQRG